MKTISINLYNYDELSPEAKAKAMADFNNDPNNHDGHGLEAMLTEDAKELIKDYGILDNDGTLKLYYSLSNCQGDGVCFTGRFEWKNYIVEVAHVGRYYHSHSQRTAIYLKDGEEIDDNDVHEAFGKIYQSVCHELEKNGYQYIEEEQSEESFISACEANEYTFEADGTIHNA